MALVFPNGGEEIVLSYLTNKDTPEDLVVHLYSNNYTPIAASEVGDFTEATFSGYASIPTEGADWTITPGDPTEAECIQVTFTCDANLQNESIYGYYITRETSGDLVYAERFPAGPYVVENNGHEIRVTPRIQLDNA